MTPDQYRDTIAQLGLSQGHAAQLFRVAVRTSHAWANGSPIPRAVELVLHALKQRSHRVLVDELKRVRAG